MSSGWLNRREEGLLHSAIRELNRGGIRPLENQRAGRRALLPHDVAKLSRIWYLFLSNEVLIVEGVVWESWR